ncbi:hypothetical protein QYE76_036843 [Lolium multiflorum]|uniref:Uncharacterized protein n=1 Tax=Lolium multiflorum TaxID=4521 RepID=A0AAD8R1M3_LOLMU|nr:hypothetical protein QYE76_036843 [Lolium multiflorum]
MDGLTCPNGAAVSQETTYVVAHNIPYQAHMYYLQGQKASRAVRRSARLPGQLRLGGNIVEVEVLTMDKGVTLSEVT